jgi:hypothetical protein
MIMLTPEQEALKAAANSDRDLEFESLISHELVSELFTALEAARNAGSEAPVLGLTQYEPIRKTDALRALKSQPALKLAEDGKGE